MRDYGFPAGWAFDPEAEAVEVHDTCPECGREIDDDTEIYLTYDEEAKEWVVVGCEECVTALSAYESNDRGYTKFIELKYDPFLDYKRRVTGDDD